MKGAKDAPGIPPLPGKRAEAHVGDPPPVAPDAGKSDDDDKDESKIDPGWVQTLNDAYSKGDPKAVAALESDKADATLYFLGGKTVSGKALADFHAEFAKAFPDAKFTVDDSWVVDNFVIAQRTLTGTQKTRFGGVAPSKKPVTLHLAEVYALGDDGKVQHTWSYADLSELVPPPAAKAVPIKQAHR
jgi:predicted ester cyclase